MLQTGVPLLLAGAFFPINAGLEDGRRHPKKRRQCTSGGDRDPEPPTPKAGSSRLLILALVAFLMACVATFAASWPATAARSQPDTAQCAPGVDLFGFSDALNKRTFESTNVGGLSGLTYDAGRDVYYGLVDNEGTTPARFYKLRLPTDGQKLGKPRILDVTSPRCLR